MVVFYFKINPDIRLEGNHEKAEPSIATTRTHTRTECLASRYPSTPSPLGGCRYVWAALTIRLLWNALQEDVLCVSVRHAVSAELLVRLGRMLRGGALPVLFPSPPPHCLCVTSVHVLCFLFCVLQVYVEKKW
jgi:hypothetical protein